MGRDLAIALVLLLATLFVYGEVGSFDFVSFDDDWYVYQNEVVQRGLSWEGVRWAFTDFRVLNWHPLTWLSHMLDCELFGVAPGRHHQVNVLLHAVNALLLFWLLRRLTAEVWPSAFVALVFAVHPLRVESVAWVAERKDVLSGAFWLLTLLAYAHAVRAPGRARRLLVALLLALSLLAKPIGVTLPLVLLLLDLWPLSRWHWSREALRELRPLLLEKLPLFAIALAAGLVTLAAQSSGGAVHGLGLFPFGERLCNALVSSLVYLWKSVWPTGLAFFYPHPSIVARDAAGWLYVQGALAGIVLLAVSVAAIQQAGRRPWLLVGWLFYLVTLAPVVGLVQVGDQARADRYAYLPLVGVTIAVAWQARELAARGRRARLALVTAAALFLATCLVLSRTQVGHWHDSRALYEHALRVTEQNYMAHFNLGQLLQSSGELDAAAAHYETAIRIVPVYASAHNNLAMILQQRGEPEAAERHYRAALEARPDDAESLSNLGVLLVGQGDAAGAVASLERAVRSNPELANARANLGMALAALGDVERAQREYEHALRLDPEHADAHTNLGTLWVARGELAEAARHFARALRANPQHALARRKLEWVRQRLGRSDPGPGGGVPERPRP